MRGPLNHVFSNDLGLCFVDLAILMDKATHEGALRGGQTLVVKMGKTGSE